MKSLEVFDPKSQRPLCKVCVASLIDSIVSLRNSWSPHAIRLSMYFITTVFWNDVLRSLAIRCGLNGFFLHSSTLASNSKSKFQFLVTEFCASHGIVTYCQELEQDVNSLFLIIFCKVKRLGAPVSLRDLVGGGIGRIKDSMEPLLRILKLLVLA